MSAVFGAVLLAAIIFGVATPLIALGATAVQMSPEMENLLKEKNAADQASPTSGAPCQGTVKILYFNTGIPNDPICAFLAGVDWLVDGFFLVPFSIAEYFFTWALEENLSFNEPGHPINFAVSLGYPIVLGVANMFFVLILLWIAVATIFDFEPYTARQLLMTLIVTALLINFSRPIAEAFINLSNGITATFYRQLIQSSPTKSLRGALNKTFNAQALVKNATEPAKGVAELCKDLSAEKCMATIEANTTDEFTDQSGRHVTITASQCRSAAGPSEGNRGSVCRSLFALAQRQAELVPTEPRSFYKILSTQIAWKIIIYPIAIFVLFAAAILLVSRIVSLGFVLILGPAAFLMNILPNTKEYNKMWWNKLSHLSFFFPAFMFFFWIGVVMVQKIPDSYYTAQIAGNRAINIYSAMGAYLLATAFIIGSIIVASKGGAYGSKMVTDWGSKAAGWAKDRGWKYGGMTTSALNRVPGVRGVIGRIPPLRAGVAAIIKKGEGVAKKDTAFYTKLSDRELSNSLRGMSRGQRQEVWSALDAKRQARIHAEAEKQGFDVGISVAKPTWRQQTISAAAGRPVPKPKNIIMPSLDAARQSIRESVKPIFDKMLPDYTPIIQGAVRNALEETISKMPARATPENFNSALRESARRAVEKAAPDRPQFAKDVEKNIGNRANDIGRAVGAAMRTKVERPKKDTTEDLAERLDQVEADVAENKEK